MNVDVKKVIAFTGIMPIGISEYDFMGINRLRWNAIIQIDGNE